MGEISNTARLGDRSLISSDDAGYAKSQIPSRCMTWYRHLSKCSLRPEPAPMNRSYRPVTYALERVNLNLSQPGQDPARSSPRTEPAYAILL